MRNLILMGSISASIIVLVFVFTPQAESGIPPTPAFSLVTINGVPIVADSYNDRLDITTSGSISATVNGNAVTIKLKAISCPILQGIADVDANGNLVCSVI